MGALLAAVLLPSCGAGGTSDDRPLVIATTTIVGDVVANVVGDAARLEVIMPLGADPHEFEASSRQVAWIADADLVVANGLGLEEGLDDVLGGARADGVRVLELAPAVDPLRFGHDREVDDSQGLDPHIWLDPRRVALAARRIADALDEIAPSPGWHSRATEYTSALQAADGRIVRLLETIPIERRVLVTTHESFGYFADRYAFEVVGVVIPGGSTLAEPGSREIADLVALIDARGLPAIFAETTEPTDLARAISAEADHPVTVVVLYIGSLGEPGSPADTLVGMLEENARLIVEALR